MTPLDALLAAALSPSAWLLARYDVDAQLPRRPVITPPGTSAAAEEMRGNAGKPNRGDAMTVLFGDQHRETA